MITRIVKLTFKIELISDFIEIWNDAKDKIANREGCHFVEMLQTIDDSNVCFTYSIWDDEDSLNAYRHSELFKQTWAKTKVLFDGKPEAWSTNSQGFSGKLIKNNNED
ncbi:MAG: antibiotic biosynthesis monooxygenase family protein [Saprospiraceae bacterium]